MSKSLFNKEHEWFKRNDSVDLPHRNDSKEQQQQQQPSFIPLSGVGIEMTVRTCCNLFLYCSSLEKSSLPVCHQKCSSSRFFKHFKHGNYWLVFMDIPNNIWNFGKNMTS